MPVEVDRGGRVDLLLGEVFWSFGVEESLPDEGFEGVAGGIAVSELDVWAFVEEGAFLDLLIDPFFDDGVLESLERADKGAICAGNPGESLCGVKTGICHGR